MKHIYFLSILFTCNLIFAQPNWEKTSCGDDPQTYEMAALLEDGNAVVLNFANDWSGICSLYTAPLNDVYVNFGSGTEGVQVFNFVTVNSDIEATNCEEVEAWHEVVGSTYPGFDDCLDIFDAYGEEYGLPYILTLVYIPDPESPGEGIEVYNNITDLGVVTEDPLIDITNVLEENNIFASVEEIVANPVIGTYPNPTTGQVTFSEQLTNVEVYNSTGQMVYSSTTCLELDLSQFPNGLYMIKSDEGMQKVIKE
jgi:hypothetical protein